MQSETEQRLKVLAREAFARRKLMVAVFVVVALATVAAGLNWPKTYRSSTTLLVEEQEIIEPLLSGSGGGRSSGSPSDNARELLFSHSLLREVLDESGRVTEATTPAQIEGMIGGIRGSTLVTNAGQNLIKIEYQGDDAQEVYETTRLMAEQFMEELRNSRANTSNAAYEFINQQVIERERQLAEAEQRLNEMQEANPDARPGAAQRSAERIASLSSQLDTLQQELRSAQIRENSLREQLSGETASGAVTTRATQLQTRINELQSQLDTLLLTYTDTYPDVVVLKQQIADLRQVLAEEGDRPVAGAEALTNPVYQDLQARLYDARTTIETLQARISSTREMLSQAMARASKVQEASSQFQQLTRDYEVNQAIYQDLLRRREKARVAMDLSTDNQGLTLRVVEPAYLSYSANGPQLVHFALGGIVLGALVPLGLLFGMLSVDPRVRTSSTISEQLQLPVLGVVPHMNTPRESRADRRGLFLAGMIVVLTIAAVVAVLVLRAQGVI